MSSRFPKANAKRQLMNDEAQRRQREAENAEARAEETYAARLAEAEKYDKMVSAVLQELNALIPRGGVKSLRCLNRSIWPSNQQGGAKSPGWEIGTGGWSYEDGNWFQANLIVEPIFDSDNRITGFACWVRGYQKRQGLLRTTSQEVFQCGAAEDELIHLLDRMS